MGAVYVINFDCFRTLGQYVLVASKMTDNFRILNTPLYYQWTSRMPGGLQTIEKQALS